MLSDRWFSDASERERCSSARRVVSAASSSRPTARSLGPSRARASSLVSRSARATDSRASPPGSDAFAGANAAPHAPMACCRCVTACVRPAMSEASRSRRSRSSLFFRREPSDAPAGSARDDARPSPLDASYVSAMAMCVRAAAVASSRDRRPPAAVTAATWTFASASARRCHFSASRWSPAAVADEARFCASAKRIAGVCHAGGAVERARAFFADRGGESGEVAEDHSGRPRGRAVAAGIARDASYAAERDEQCADSMLLLTSNVRLERSTRARSLVASLRPNRERIFGRSAPERGGAGRATSFGDAVGPSAMEDAAHDGEADIDELVSAAKVREARRPLARSRAFFSGAQIRAFRCQDSSAPRAPATPRASSNAR